jgi:hypothetical protein
MNRNIRLLSLLALLLVLAASAVAQVATADLHVAVKDQKGAVIKNATVTVRNEALGQERSQTENVEGEYPFRALTPGKYEVSVEAPGFAKHVAKNVTITIGQIAELPVSMQLAAVSEVVNVSSEAELIETQRTTTSTTVDQTRIENLPINGRNYIQFALTNSQLARDTAPSIGAAPTSGLNVGGQRARNNLVNVDGMDAVDNSTNGVRSTVSQEAVQEFQLLTNGYTAEYGRASGGVISIVTKSGTNAMHGTAYGYLRNRNLQAVNPFSTEADPAYTRVQAGLSVGGPIKKDRTFYYFAFETNRRRETGFSSIGQGNFGLVSAPGPFAAYKVTPEQATWIGHVLAGDPGYAAFAPLLTTYVGTVGNSSAMALNGHWTSNPALSAFVITQGVATPGVANFVPLMSVVGNYPITELTDNYSLRLDHKLTNNQQLMLRGGVSPSNLTGIQVQAQGAQFVGQNAYSRSSINDFHDWSITAQHTWTIGTNKVNEFRYQYSRRGLSYTYSNSKGGDAVGMQIAGAAILGREPFSYVNRVEQRNQFTDVFSWTKGKHSVKWGGDVNYLPLKADFTVNFGGLYNFGGISSATIFGSNPLTAPLAAAPGMSSVQAYGFGLPQNFIQGVGNPHDEFSNTAMGFFIQDSWRMTRKLTINYGVRYDVEFTPVFAATTPTAAAAEKALGVTQGIPRDYNNFAPRIGFAFDPWGDSKTVIRGSFGMFYDHPLLGLAFDSDVADASQAPQLVLIPGAPGITATNCTAAGGYTALNATNAYLGLLGCLPANFGYLPGQQRFNPTPNQPANSVWTNQNFLTQGVPMPFLPWGLPTAANFQYAYSNQASLGMEHDFGKGYGFGMTYNFNGGRHLNRPINANAVVAPALYANWKAALAGGDPGATSGPTTVGSSGAPCGSGPLGPWVSPVFMNFFRRSGPNPSYAGLLAGPAAACAPIVAGLTTAYGLGVGTVVPFSDMTANFSNGSSVYHGMTATLRKRMTTKYEFLVSYTWSHAIDDSTDLESPLAPQNNYNPSAERSISLFDQRHRFVFSGVYQSGKMGTGVWGKIASNWTFAPIIEVGSGRPFNILTGADTNIDFGSSTDRPMVGIPGEVLPASCQASLPSKYSPTGLLRPACYAAGEIYGGNLGRNAGRKPWTFFNDLRVSRQINITERWKLDAIVDMFNLINKNNVADVNNLWSVAGIPTAAFDPRQFQLALRLSW